MPVTFKGVTTSTTTTITLPTHAVGDMIVIFAYRFGSLPSDTPPSQPTAGGTVPTWTTISANTGNNNGTNANSMRVSYTVATATNHTSGTWSNSNRMVAVVVTGQRSSPVGGYAEAAAGASTVTMTAPAITLSDASGNSLILHCVCCRVGSNFTWGAAPSGYTRLGSDGSNNGYSLARKDNSTADGSVNFTILASNILSRAASLEILAPPVTSQFLSMF